MRAETGMSAAPKSRRRARPAATKFARDILSVADNLGRALAASARNSAPTGHQPLITGLETTERELLGVFERNGITRIAAIGLPAIPTSIRRCSKSRARMPSPARSCRKCRRDT